MRGKLRTFFYLKVETFLVGQDILDSGDIPESEDISGKDNIIEKGGYL